jgi:hypothetical protein
MKKMDLIQDSGSFFQFKQEIDHDSSALLPDLQFLEKSLLSLPIQTLLNVPKEALLGSSSPFTEFSVNSIANNHEALEMKGFLNLYPIMDEIPLDDCTTQQNNSSISKPLFTQDEFLKEKHDIVETKASPKNTNNTENLQEWLDDLLG